MTLVRLEANLVHMVAPASWIDDPALRSTARYQGFMSVVQYLQEIAVEHARLGHMRLPGERDLSIKLGISRSLVREALRALETAGMVEARPNSGWYLTSAGARADGVPASANPGAEDLSTEALLEFLSFRLLLEPGLAAWAAQNADSQDIALLQAAVEDDPLVPLESSERGASFHAAVAAASKNPHAVNLYNSNDLFVYWTGVALSIRAYDTREEHDREHRGILQAILEADSDAARDLTERHIRRSIALIRSNGRAGELYEGTTAS